jgi:Arc/MetJ-type ribon-helix-helix transcriptional regulator
MSRKMTVVFHDEDLYTYLKVEAARRHIAASDIVNDAVREWLESREDAELLPQIEVARAEWKEKGGRPWSEVEQEVEEVVTQRERAAEAKSVQA